MHWHATAAEWAFVLEGRIRTTVIDPEGNSETNDFDPETSGSFRADTATCSMPGQPAIPLHSDLR